MDAATIAIALEVNSSGVTSGLGVAAAAVNAFGGRMTAALATIKNAATNLIGGNIVSRAGLSQAVAGVKAMETSVVRSAGRMSAAFAAIGGKAAFIGMTAGVAALTLAVSASIGPAIRFESAFAGVKKTVDGTPQQLDRIRVGLLNMSKAIPVSAQGLAEIAANAGQLGVAADDVLQFTETIATLAATTNLDLEEGAQALARFFNITGGNLSTELTTVADVIVTLGNNLATTESDIVRFSQRIAAAGTLVGANEVEILSVAAAYSSLGLEAEAGGTAVSRIWREMSDAALSGTDSLATFAEVAGKTNEEMAELIKNDPRQALYEFERGLGQIIEAGGNVAPILEAVNLSGIRVSDTLLRGANNAEFLAQAFGIADRAAAEGGAAAEELALRLDTVAAKLETFKNQLNVLAINVGTPFLGGLAALLDGIGDALERVVTDLAPAASALQEFGTDGAKAIAALLDALGSPIFLAAANAISGLAIAITGIVSVLNAIPGAAEVATVGIASFIIATKLGLIESARASIFALALNLAAVGPAGTAAAAGLAAVNVALAVGPLVLVTAAVFAVGKAWQDAGQKAQEASTKFKDATQQAFDTGSVNGLRTQLANVREELAALDEAASPFGTGRWGQIANGLKGAFQVFTPATENSIMNSARAFDELQASLNASDLQHAVMVLDLLASRVGVTSDEMAGMLQATGQFEEVLTGGTLAALEMVPVFQQMAEATDGLGDNLAESQEAWSRFVALMDSGAGTLTDVAEQLGISEAALRRLAEAADIDAQGLLDEGQWRGLLVVVGPLAEAYGEAAAAIGQTTDQMVAGIEAVDRMASSYDKLSAAVDSALSALDALNAQQAAVTEATAAWDAALQGVTQGNLPSLEAAAGAMRQLSAEYAASGVSAEEAADKQLELYGQLIAVGTAAEFTQEDIQGVAIELGLIPEEVIAEITVLGEQAKADADAVRENLENLAAGDYIASLVMSWDDEQYQEAKAAADDWDGTEAEAEALIEVFGVDDLEEALRILSLLGDRTIAIRFKTSGQTTVVSKGKNLGTYPSDTFTADGALRFAEGGQAGGDVANGHLPEITKPMTPIRVWSEPETGGEAYIPLANDWRRPRARSILRETASRLGMGGSFASGGIVQSFASGGATFSTSIGLPVVQVAVQVDTESLGEVGIDLRPVVGVLQDIGTAANVADARLQAAFAGGIINQEVLRSNRILAVGTIREIGDSSVVAGRQMALALDPSRFTALFSQLSGWAQDSFERWLNTWDGAWDGTVSQALSKLDRAGLETQHIFRRLGSDAAIAGKEMALALDPSFFLDVFSDISGWAKDSFRDWLGEWDGTVESAVKKLEDAGLELDHIWNGVAESSVVAGRTMAEAMDPAVFIDKFSEISGWAEESLTSWLGAWDGSVADAIRILEEAGLEMDHIWEAIAEGAGTSAAEMYDSFSQAGLDMVEAAVAAGEEMVEAMDPEEFIAIFERISGVAVSSIEGWAEEWDGTVSGAVRLLEEAGADMSAVFEEVFREGATEAEVIVAAIDTIAGSLEEVEDAAGDAKRALDVLFGIQLELIDAQIEYLDAVSSVRETMSEGGAFGFESEEARRNLKSLVSAGEAMQDYALAIAQSGVTAEEAIAKWRQMEAEFIALATAAGVPAATVATLAESLFGIPDSLITTVAVEGLEKARDVELYRDTINEIDGTTSTATLELVADAAAERINEVDQRLSELEDEAYQAELELESEQLEEDLAAVEQKLSELEESDPAKVELELEKEELEASLEAVREELDLIGDEEYKVELELEREQLIEDLGLVLQRMEELTGEDYVLVLGTDKENAEAELIALEDLAKKMTEGEYIVVVGADDQAARDVLLAIEQDITVITAEPITFRFDVDAEEAEQTITRISGIAVDYTTGDYTADLSATDSASPTIEAVTGAAVSYNDVSYNGSLTASDDGATSTISAVKADADGYVGTYNATLTADSGQAVSAISSAVSALSGFNDKTVTITTVNRTVNEGPTAISAANGGIISFAGGGIEDHIAQIAKAGSYRVWAEPETGGEAYIPLAPSKRGRSLAILEEVAAMFGRALVPAFADGGLVGATREAAGGTQIVVDAPINVSVPAGSSADMGRQVASAAEAAVDRLADRLERAVARR